MSVKGTMRRRSFYRQASDYLRYTFTPMFGIMTAIGNLGVLTTIAIAPDLLRVLFAFYIAIFSSAMVVSFFAWRRYWKFYNNVFRK